MFDKNLKGHDRFLIETSQVKRNFLPHVSCKAEDSTIQIVREEKYCYCKFSGVSIATAVRLKISHSYLIPVTMEKPRNMQ